MRRLFVLVALPLCMAEVRQPAPPIMSCDAITNRTTMTELQQRYGDFDAAEKLDVTWADAEKTRMAALWTTDRKSAWRAANGIKVSMKIADVELLNERQFYVSGFETDEPGLVVSWAGGKLEPTTQSPSISSGQGSSTGSSSTGSGQERCRLVVRVAPTVSEFTTAEWRLIEPIQFAPQATSDDKRFKTYKPVVSAIGLDWR